jgi:hypothetical protein
MSRKVVCLRRMGTIFGSASLTILAVLSVARNSPAQDPAGATKKQGSGITIELGIDFIKKYADKVTIETDYVVEKVSKIHAAKDDGEVHIGGIALEAELPTVAELTNPSTTNAGFFKSLEGKSKADRTVHMTGVWRFWCEHAGTKDQIQGGPLPAFTTSNPDHVFEIHPIIQFKDQDLLDTLKPIAGYDAKTAHNAFLAYENAPCHIEKNGSRVTIKTKVVGNNFVEFVLKPLAPDSDHPQPVKVVDDGRFVMCQVYDIEGELIARRRRMVFVKDSVVDKKVKNLADGHRLHVIGIPRISLRLIQWRLENASDPKFDHPLDWDLPYEIVVIGFVEELGSDDE